ncbi:hypothetical protein KC331_g10934 [Hortaea werneckii]|nr:hypothetical protein KC331_g10934 [Hortaea werneckii]KAI7709329.1 hypothetical protein KC353_g10434 [Hortaea werneckii]
MGKKDKSKKSKGQASLGLQQPDAPQQPGAYQPPQSTSGTGYGQQCGYPPQLQGQAQSHDQWPAVQNQAPQPQQWQGEPQYGESSNNVQQQTTTTTKVTRHVQHVSNRRQARGFQEQQQRPFQHAQPPPMQQPQQRPPPARKQNTLDYELLRVAMPAPQTPTPAPARGHRHVVQEPDSLPPLAPQRNKAYWHDAPATEGYEGQHDGGETRRQAEAQGPEAVEEYERRVFQLLTYSGICPAGFKWFNMSGGYICGGGTHWMSHKAIDDYFSRVDRTPRVEAVNVFSFNKRMTAVHPPTGVGPAAETAHYNHWGFMRLVSSGGGYARIVRQSSHRRGGENQGFGQKPYMGQES